MHKTWAEVKLSSGILFYLQILMFSAIVSYKN